MVRTFAQSKVVPSAATHKSTGRPNPPGPLTEYKAHYRDYPNAARFAFGHGLTYGKIAYSGFAADPATVGWDGAIAIRATVTNNGAHPAEEVAQLYIHDVAASITRPVRQLKAYRKITLAPVIFPRFGGHAGLAGHAPLGLLGG
ncbi:fibronectin type III-like domain-contianing protein [Sphingomonas oligophenolica]|uniref:fibronectin type III-like domain-contianing protein n=1 Tax=Sphingomonas oligophenolica TaxID=301154 RepID=UPI0030C89B21